MGQNEFMVVGIYRSPSSINVCALLDRLNTLIEDFNITFFKVTDCHTAWMFKLESVKIQNLQLIMYLQICQGMKLRCNHNVVLPWWADNWFKFSKLQNYKQIGN